MLDCPLRTGLLLFPFLFFPIDISDEALGARADVGRANALGCADVPVTIALSNGLPRRHDAAATAVVPIHDNHLRFNSKTSFLHFTLKPNWGPNQFCSIKAVYAPSRKNALHDGTAHTHAK